MDISKDEVYKLAKETVEKKTAFIDYLIVFISLISILSLFAGMILLNLRLVLGSALAIFLTDQLIKIFKKSKEKFIEKLVEEHDEKRV